jgi:hypothetical protein
VPYATLEAAVRAGAGTLLDGLWWFDEYRGEQVGEGRRSVAVRLRLQDAERQLTEDDEKQVIEAVASAAERSGPRSDADRRADAERRAGRRWARAAPSDGRAVGRRRARPAEPQG